MCLLEGDEDIIWWKETFQERERELEPGWSAYLSKYDSSGGLAKGMFAAWLYC
jgi:hypothetical protein